MSDSRPRRLKFGAEGEQREDPVVQSLGDKLPQELQGRGIHPVQVLDDEQNRPLRRAACSQSSKARKVSSRLARPGTAKAAGTGRWSGATAGKPTSGTVSGRARRILIEGSHEPVEAGLGCVLGSEFVSGSKFEGALEEVDGRIQPRVLEMGRAAPFDDRRVGLAFDELTEDMVFQCVDQPRFAQARFTDRAARPGPCPRRLLPPIFEQA